MWPLGLGRALTFNPQTLDGDILVDGIVTSTYTTAVAPRVARAVLSPLRLLYTLDGQGFGDLLTESSLLSGLLPRQLGGDQGVWHGDNRPRRGGSSVTMCFNLNLMHNGADNAAQVDTGQEFNG